MLSDIRIVDAIPVYSMESFRIPLKFGGATIDECTYSLVEVVVENRSGKVAKGHGAILLSDFWGFPSEKVPHSDRVEAMSRVTDSYCRMVKDYSGFRHPIDIFFDLENGLRELGDSISREMHLAEKMPFLGTLVSASPVDAALHDGFGNVNGICTYDGYGYDYMENDLGYYLGSEFNGRHISDYIKKNYDSAVPVFHLVGGVDKLTEKDTDGNDPHDGLPNTLEDWIKRDGVFCLKVKLRGIDLQWDIERMCKVAEIAYRVHDNMGTPRVIFSVDPNEQCESPEYMVEFLRKVKELAPRAYDDLLYVEQPTERDLHKNRFDVRQLSSMKPVIIDESLTSIEDFELALSLGWSGIALKTCKFQSSDLLFAAKASQMGIPYTVQDLTNPKLALIQSVGLAARLNPIMGVEANARQFLPASSAPETRIHPGMFDVAGGYADTRSLGETGLGYRFSEIKG